jgi:NAD-dependent deacetylase
MRNLNLSKFLILTGAGISVPSGLRPYRGENGMSNDPDIVKLGHKDALHNDIDAVWKLFGDFRKEVLAAQPSRAHRAIAEFEHKLGSDRVSVVTQNLDGLHYRAGSNNVVELHGSTRRTRCRNPQCETVPFSDSNSYRESAPTCRHCGHPLRPDIVFFGESIPRDTLVTVSDWLKDHDVFIAIGTSLTVAPASKFAKVALAFGAETYSVNSEPVSPAMRKYFTMPEWIGDTETIVPELLEKLAHSALNNLNH